MEQNFDVVEGCEADAGGYWALDEVHRYPLVEAPSNPLVPEEKGQRSNKGMNAVQRPLLSTQNLKRLL